MLKIPKKTNFRGTVFNRRWVSIAKTLSSDDAEHLAINRVKTAPVVFESINLVQTDIHFLHTQTGISCVYFLHLFC